MTKTEHDEINRKLDLIIAKQTLHGEGIVRIDEHLKALNGSVLRNQECINKLDMDNDTQWSIINAESKGNAEFRGMVNAKLAIVGVGSGSIVAVVAWIMSNLH